MCYVKNKKMCRTNNNKRLYKFNEQIINIHENVNKKQITNIDNTYDKYNITNIYNSDNKHKITENNRNNDKHDNINNKNDVKDKNTCVDNVFLFNIFLRRKKIVPNAVLFLLWMLFSLFLEGNTVQAAKTGK